MTPKLIYSLKFFSIINLIALLWWWLFDWFSTYYWLA